MSLFGMKKKQMFGQMFDPMSNGPYGTPGIGDRDTSNQPGYFGETTQGMGQLPDVANMPDMGAMQQQQPAKFKPNVLGVIGDAMQVFGGGQATYMQGVREQQQRAELMRQRAMQAQQERETGWQDWVKKEEYKRANPERANNDTVNDVNWYINATPAEREAYHRMKPIVQTMADGSQRLYDPTQSAPSFVPAPQGVTFTPIDGGPVQQAPGNFPR